VKAALKNPRVVLPLAVIAITVVVVALALFQPWRLLTSTTVIEAGPLTPAPTTSASSTVAPRTAAPLPMVVASGRFVSHEHRTTGEVRLIRRPDGSVVVRLEGLDTSDGPALRVWLTDQPVLTGSSGWRVFDDGRYVDLGVLKGNRGDQNYPVPPGTDLTGLTSVSVWCARFHVSFGAAALTEHG
jgi:hypothetical protein